MEDLIERLMGKKNQANGTNVIFFLLGSIVIYLHVFFVLRNIIGFSYNDSIEHVRYIILNIDLYMLNYLTG